MEIEKEEKYTFDEICEMLCGTEYYSLNHLKYVYYETNKHIEGYEDLAQNYLKLCLEEEQIKKKVCAQFKKNAIIKDEINKI